MPKLSNIPNRVHLNLSANSELVEKAKEKRINISLLLDAALERELNPAPKEAFNKAQELQNRVYKDYLQKTKQLNNFEEFKYKDVAVEKERKQIIRDFKDN